VRTPLWAHRGSTTLGIEVAELPSAGIWSDAADHRPKVGRLSSVIPMLPKPGRMGGEARDSSRFLKMGNGLITNKRAAQSTGCEGGQPSTKTGIDPP
jgi:hypothetical protein